MTEDPNPLIYKVLRKIYWSLNMKIGEVSKPHVWKFHPAKETTRLWSNAVFSEIEKTHPHHHKLCARHKTKKTNSIHPDSDNDHSKKSQTNNASPQELTSWSYTSNICSDTLLDEERYRGAVRNRAKWKPIFYTALHFSLQAQSIDKDVDFAYKTNEESTLHKALLKEGIKRRDEVNTFSVKSDSFSERPIDSFNGNSANVIPITKQNDQKQHDIGIKPKGPSQYYSQIREMDSNSGDNGKGKGTLPSSGLLQNEKNANDSLKKNQDISLSVNCQDPIYANHLVSINNQDSVSLKCQNSVSLKCQNSVSLKYQDLIYPNPQDLNYPYPQDSVLLNCQDTTYLARSAQVPVNEDPTSVKCEDLASVILKAPASVILKDPASVILKDPVLVSGQDHVPVNNQNPVPVNNQDPVPVNNQDPVPANKKDPIPVNNQDPVPVNFQDQVGLPVNNQDPEPANNQDPVPVNNQDSKQVTEKTSFSKPSEHLGISKSKSSRNVPKSSVAKKVILRSDMVPNRFLKSYDVRTLLKTKFVEKFRAYAKEKGRYSGSIISNGRSIAWLKNAEINSVLDLSDVEKQFATITGQKLVMSIHEYVRFLMKICRGKISITEFISRLSDCPGPLDNIPKGKENGSQKLNDVSMFTEAKRDVFGDLIQTGQKYYRQLHSLPSLLFPSWRQRYLRKNVNKSLSVKRKKPVTKF